MDDHLGLGADHRREVGAAVEGQQGGGEAVAQLHVPDWDTALLPAELGLGRAVVPALPGHAVPRDDGPPRLVSLRALPPLSVGWAVRRWDALTPPTRAFADTVADSCRRNAPAAPGG
ncbi:hypothetical protein GCM10027074_50720 [Streptomyces deserti]